MRRRLAFIALAVLVLVAGGGAAWTVKKQADQAARCTPQVAYAQTASFMQPVTTGTGPTVVVLGDSYAEGAYLPNPRQDGWPARLAEGTGWTTYVSGVGGTGFVNGGPCGDRPFATRTDLVLAKNPRLVIVEGGLNDVESDPGQAGAAAERLAHDLGRSGAEVVLVGPARAPSRPDAAERIDRELMDVAAATGTPYVSSLSWDLPFRDDGLHLTAEGHRVFAEQIRAALPADVD